MLTTLFQYIILPALSISIPVALHVFKNTWGWLKFWQTNPCEVPFLIDFEHFLKLTVFFSFFLLQSSCSILHCSLDPVSSNMAVGCPCHYLPPQSTSKAGVLHLIHRLLRNNGKFCEFAVPSLKPATMTEREVKYGFLSF